MNSGDLKQLTDDHRDINTALAILRTIDAQRRTHLAELRTGIGILTIPMSLLTILIATSDYYQIGSVLTLIVIVVIGIILLSGIGAYLVIRALQKLRTTEKLRLRCKDVACLLDDYENNHQQTSF